MIHLPARREATRRRHSLLLAAAVSTMLWGAATAAPAVSKPPVQATAADPAGLRGLADFVDGVMAEQIAARESRAPS